MKSHSDKKRHLDFFLPLSCARRLLFACQTLVSIVAEMSVIINISKNKLHVPYEMCFFLADFFLFLFNPCVLMSRISTQTVTNAQNDNHD